MRNSGLASSTENARSRFARHCLGFMALFLLGLAWASGGNAQGPSVEYFYHPGTTLEWASCTVTQDGGSELRVPFLPVILTAPVQAPVGTEKYTESIAVSAPMVFVGDGIVSDTWNAYDHTFAWASAPIDVQGKVALLCYDCANSLVADSAPGSSLAARVQALATRGAIAAVLLSSVKEAPFLFLDSSDAPVPEIPLITVTRTTAADILDAAAPGGREVLDQLKAMGEPPPSRDLITRLQLRIEGTFDRLETEHFLFLFRASRIDRKAVAAASSVHETALTSIRNTIGNPDDRSWPQATTVYFAGFDSKLFFTHHWGFGLSNDAGAFLQWDGGEADLGLITHEHTHTFTALNWGRSSSFMEEGVARFVESQVTDASMNDQETRCLLDRGKLPPLVEMLYIDVGGDELTPIAYPAAGSLVGYLLETNGMQTLRRIFELEGQSREEKGTRDTWQQALSKSLGWVDQDWRSWLRSRKLEQDCPP
jgi:hypothetical protein